MATRQTGHPRVILITPKYPPVPSGYGNQAFAVNQRLMGSVSIRVVTPESTPLPVELVHQQAVSSSHRPRDYSVAQVGKWIIKTLWWLVKERREFDIVHILSGYYWAVPFVVAGRLLKKPTIVKITSAEIDLTTRRSMHRRLRIWFLKGVSVLIVLTEHTRRIALKQEFSQRQVMRIPNGVDVERYSEARANRRLFRKELNIPDDCFVVLYVGQLGRRKGVDRLLDVWREFRKNASGPVRLFLVGAPDGSVSLAEIARLDDVHLVGHVNQPERYYGSADAFVLLSRSEGMANVLLEATAAGVPIIVSDIPPNRELALQLDGFVASGSDSELILQATAHLKALEQTFRTQPALAKNDRGQEIVRQQYSLASVANQYKALYQVLSRD